jgi:hypothetical protein
MALERHALSFPQRHVAPTDKGPFVHPPVPHPIARLVRGMHPRFHPTIMPPRERAVGLNANYSNNPVPVGARKAGISGMAWFQAPAVADMTRSTTSGVNCVR